MRPEIHSAMHRALELGPDFCPPDLFAGSIAAIVSGLKAHSATIVQARHAALHDSFPRTRSLMGEPAFDAAAERHMAHKAVLSRPLDSIGLDFPDLLSGAARRLAQIEWAWLESYGAPNARALTLADLAGLDPELVIAMNVAIHPAARLIVAPGDPVEFDGVAIQSAHVLITRPDCDVRVIEADAAAARLLHLLHMPRAMGELLDRDAGAAVFLLTNGALMRTQGGDT